MKYFKLKIYLTFILAIFQITQINHINAMEQNQQPELPSEIWTLIFSKLINTENIKSAKNLNELKSQVKDLFESFALISKKHKFVVENMLEKKDYLNKKRELIKEILQDYVPNFDWDNINAKDDKDDWTGLIYAAYYDYKDIVKFLIQNKADINIKDKYGHTALTWAIFKRHKKIIELLITKDADTSIIPEHIITNDIKEIFEKQTKS